VVLVTLWFALPLAALRRARRDEPGDRGR
jgi:hypothetical protein